MPETLYSALPVMRFIVWLGIEFLVMNQLPSVLQMQYPVLVWYGLAVELSNTSS